ncbi:MAG: ABC transporter ATP-binding protein [Acidimicrobiia bacterium]|nr:ABC transporter ATP-binding protein [Acidimicrobiia bacterium]
MTGVAAVRCEGLSMSYDGSRGIVDVDLDIPTGEVFGFLGPNGAGKTTTIRVLLDLLRPTSGRVSVLGLDSVRESIAIRTRTGYLPGDLSLPSGLTGTEVLDWLSSLRPTTPPVRRSELVDRFEVQVDRPMKHLSKGNRQKIGLVQAFQHAPEMVILDEPTGGLDPLVQDEFHRFVREYVADGGTVFLSSHSLDEVQHTADRVGIIRDGRVVTVETVDALRGRGLRRVSVTVRSGTGESAETRLQVTDGVADVHRRGDLLEFSITGEYAPVLAVLGTLPVVDLLSRAADLDEVFLELYRGDDGSAR